jgi:hypothetical protein
MQSFWNSFWPWLFLFACLGLLVLIGSGISLKSALIRMRQEHQESTISPWHRRPKVRGSLKGIAISLATIVLAVWMGVILSLPLRAEDLNLIVLGSLVSIGVCISLLIEGIRLILDFRTFHQERREELPSFWHQQPKILKRIAGLFSRTGIVLQVGLLIYLQIVFVLHLDNEWMPSWFVFIAVPFYLAYMVITLYADFIRTRSKSAP